MTIEPPSHDKSGSLYQKNPFEPSLEPSAGTEDEPKTDTPTPFRGEDLKTPNDDQVPKARFVIAGEGARSKWEHLLATLKLDLGSQPVHSNFSRIVPGCSDWEACFAWTLLAGSRTSGHPPDQPRLTLVLALPDARGANHEATRAGLAKYAKRLETLVREYYPIPKSTEIRFELTEPKAAEARQEASHVA